MNALGALKTLVILGQDIPAAVFAAAIDQLARKDRKMAKKLAEYAAEFQTALADNTAKIQAQTTVIGGVKTLLEGLVAQNAALKTQLEEAIANGGDPAVLQPILDALNVQDDAIQSNTDAITAAVAANTPQG